MYWSLSDDGTHWFTLLLLFAVIAIAGWLTSSSVFRLHRRERLIVGVGVGLVEYVFISNILGQLLPPEISFWLSAFVVLLVGAAFWFLQEERRFDLRDFEVWPLMLVLLVITVWITLMGRGVAIFDDRKNLSIISTMAAGDIPPHFYMNPDLLFNYHYGFQLLGAGMMRLGALLPWSAFDLSKGFVSALAIVLAFTWGWRVSHSKMWGVLTAVVITFASGSRWLLNLLPRSALIQMSVNVDLWGASNSTLPSLFEGLSGAWSIDGGPPLPLPFAYINGILQPFILKLHKGPISLSFVILFLVLLLIQNFRSRPGTLVLGMIFAAWAFVAEAEFLLFGAGFLLVILVVAGRSGIRSLREHDALIYTGFALAGAAAASLFQGGTITEIAKGLVGLRPENDLGGGTGLGGFSFRWPPAIVSAHLGELRLTEPIELLGGLFEIGPAVIAGIVILFYIRRWIRRERWSESILALGSYAGFFLPIVLRYDVDRDITRFSAYALVAWILLAIPILAVVLRRWRFDWLRMMAGGWLLSLIYGGLVVTGSLLTAMPRPEFSYQIADLDVHMTKLVWDELPQDTLVIDSHEWRVVPITGRHTRSYADNTTPLDSWIQHVESSDASELASAGYDFAYIDNVWWDDMDVERQASFARGCANLVEEITDTSGVNFRRLYDISSCR